MRHNRDELQKEYNGLAADTQKRTKPDAQEISRILAITKNILNKNFSDTQTTDLAKKINDISAHITTLKKQTILRTYTLLKKCLEYQADVIQIQDIQAQQEAAQHAAAIEKQKAEKRKQLESSVVKIQNLLRMRQVTDLIQTKQIEAKKKNEETARHEAATVIQNTYRRHQAVTKANTLRDEKEKARNAIVREAAATTIQCLFRTHQAVEHRNNLAADKAFLFTINKGIGDLKAEYISYKGNPEKAKGIFNVTDIDTNNRMSMTDAFIVIVIKLRNASSYGASSKTLPNAEKLAANLKIALPPKPAKTSVFSSVASFLSSHKKTDADAGVSLAKTMSRENC